ncbi:MAG: NUMOD4 domain-containing protein [Candidatus Alectryocaccobium sp.]|jgi:hypothetical protein
MRLKEIKDFKDRYMVSDDGRIFSLRDFSGRKRFIEKKQYTDKYGYKCCMLYKNGEKKHVTIHRVVATAFLENKANYPQVNHIDGNKSNNMVSNFFNVCKQAVATAIHRGNKCKGWNVAWMRD